MTSFPPTAPAARRRRGLRVAVVVWAVLVVALLALAVVQFVRYTALPPDQHVGLAGGTVTITEPGEYSVYYETARDGSYGELTGITGPDGAPVRAVAASVNETYTLNARAGVKLGSFTATTPGEYRLTGAAEGSTPGDELVVGTRTVGAMLGTVFTAIAAALVLVIGGVVLLIVFLVGRNRSGPPAGQWAGAPGPWPQPGAQYPGARYPGGPYADPGPDGGSRER